ncbi:MAG: hypothetical protein DME22_03165 [Verrucomicrobia bacterium]|nr:MAG: hypothetical protein DME22_03165 [Verrucomicrobiota bacterium]PYJ94141.1 MAG: hypothetical protein DME23_25320 [Verrucomicrobiota bacterium]
MSAKITGLMKTVRLTEILDMESRKKFRRNLREPKGFSAPSLRRVSAPALQMQLFQLSGGV